MDIQLKVCDICHSLERHTRAYTISDGVKQVSRDLCSVHARPLQSLLTLIPAQQTRSTAAGLTQSWARTTSERTSSSDLASTGSAPGQPE